jgi:hypothetical protein
VPGALPAARTEVSSDNGPLPAQKGVGYKSLIEASANRTPDGPVVRSPADEPDEKIPVEKPQKGNRFFRAIGKIFHPGQKEPLPLTLRPEQK